MEIHTNGEKQKIVEAMESERPPGKCKGRWPQSAVKLVK